jgi:hypothetical protein
MKEQIKTAVPRKNIVPVESDEARKTASEHSCEPITANAPPTALPMRTTMQPIRNLSIKQISLIILKTWAFFVFL